MNKYLFKVAELNPELLAKFQPDLTPEEMKRLGVLEGKYTDRDPKKYNFFKVDASMKEWPEEWYHESAPLGWMQWYEGWSQGKRTDDDERQIKRWISFRVRHLAQLQKADPTLKELSIQPRRRQALLNWGIAPGIDREALVKKAKQEKPAPVQNTEEERPHTLRALKKLEKNKALLVDHSMGSGKTRLYLKAIEAHQKKHPKDDVLIMAPASLTTNIYKEIKKHNINIDTSKLETLSYEKAAIDAERLKKKVFGMVVADEAHKLRNTDTKRHKELSEVIMAADKRLLGTGTSAYNHPADIAPLINLVAGDKILPENKKDFENKYIDKIVEQPSILKRIVGHPPKEIHKLKNKRQLEKILRQHVDHYDLKDDPAAKDKFPEKIETVKEVEMSPEQHALYKYMEGKLPFHLRMKVRMNMPLDKKDVTALQAFSTGIRQVSNSTRSFMPNYDKHTPKVMAAVNSVHEGMQKDKNFKALVYSNYLESGLADYSKELNNRGIPHGVYHGGLSKTQKDELLEQYNSGKLPVLLLSSSGAEGLNAKGTKKVQVLEPHHNKSKIDQVVARGIRYESHEHLPKNERKVEVEHYISVFPQKRWNIGPRQHSIDQYLHHNSKTKSEIGDQMKELVKEALYSKLDMSVVKSLSSMVKQAYFDRVPHEYVRAKYKESKEWDHIVDPAGSIKRDGAAFFMEIQPDGRPRFLSRRESVKGGFPDRTANLMYLPEVRVPQFAGNAYHVELIHTGHDFHEDSLDAHNILSGILNSKPEKALATQKEIGPVRAVLLDVINPKLTTFRDKILHLAQVKTAFGDVPNLHMPNIKIGKDEISKLVEETRNLGHEGVIITSLSTPEEKNIRVKVKHLDTYNLKVVDIIQEVDIKGNLKESMGALVLADATGRIVCKVGTGFTRAQRIDAWKNKDKWMDKLVQIKALPSTASRLRTPVYNGDADGDLDTVEEWLKDQT